MNSEKVKEIKKALEQNDDNGIMYEVNDQKRTCKFIHHKDILTLINELESENEKLAKQCQEWYELNFKKKKQVVELKDRIAELEKANATKTDTIVDLLKKQEFYEKEKLKQFAERLKEKAFTVFMGEPIVRASKIDEVLQEFIGTDAGRVQE